MNSKTMTTALNSTHDNQYSSDTRFKLGRNNNGWCVRQYEGDELLETTYFGSYDEMMKFATKLLSDLEKHRLLKRLSSADIQTEIKYLVDDIVSELSEDVRVSKFDGGEDTTDCFEYEFDEEETERKFYQILSDAIKITSLNDEERKFIEKEEIDDFEFCTEYMDVWYQEQEVVDLAIRRFVEQRREER